MKTTNYPITKNIQLILLLLAFVFPIIAAKILLINDVKGRVITHGGQLLSLEYTLENIVSTPIETADWKLMYLTNKPCQQHCEEQLYYISQTYKALGRLQERLHIGTLSPNLPSTSPIVNELGFIAYQLDSSVTALEDNILIIDPLGNLVMSYRLVGSKQQRLEQSHNLLLDIKQLLKLSRIG